MKIYKYTFKDIAEFHKYDKNSPYVFEKVKELLLEKIPDAQIDHVGSTAVGCGGKGIIDMLSVHRKNVVSRILKLGFKEGKSPKDNSRRVFVGSVVYRRKRYNLHLHVMDPKHITVKNMILLRDYFRKHPAKVRQYENLKKKAISEGKTKNKEYNPVKGALIRTIIKPA